MKDGLTPGLKDAENGISSLSKKAKIATANLKAGIKEQTVRVKEATQRVKELEKAYAKAGSSVSMSKAKTELEAAKKLLREEQEDLQELKGRLQALTEATAQFGTSMRGRLREITEEIAALTLEYRNMSDEERNAASGQQLKAHIEKLTEDAGELRDAMMDTRDAIDNAASDTRGFDQMAGAMQLVVDGFGLATGAAQLFGASEEDLVEAQTKLQSVLVISNALTSMQTQLQAQSAVMQGVNIIQTKAAATAEAIKTAAQGKGIIVTKLATIAQAAFNAVAKANPYVLLAAAVVTVVGALFAFSKGSAAAKKAEEERKAQMEETKRKQEELRKVVVDAAGDQIASFLKMKKEWEALGNSFDQKKKFLADTKDEWAKLGKEISTVNEMEEMFRNGTQGMIKAIIYRAELKAYETKIQDIADKMVDKVEQNKTYKYKKARAGTAIGGWYAGYGPGSGGSWTSKEFTAEELNAVKGHTYYKSGFGGGSNYLDEEGARIITEMRKKKGNSAALQAQADARRNAENEIGGIMNTIKDIQSKLDQEMANLPGTTVDPDGNNNPKPTTPTTDTDEDRLEKERRIGKEVQKLRWQNRQSEIDQEEDASVARRKQIALDYDMEMAEVEEKERELREAQGGSLTEEQNTVIQEAYGNVKSKMEHAIKEMENEEVEKGREKLNTLLDQYKDYDQRRRDIDSSYASDKEILEAELKRVEESGGDTSQVESAIRARTDAYKKSIQELEGEILQSTTFYDKLFADTSEKGYKILKDFYAQAQEVLASAKTDKDGVEITVTDKDADGNFVKKTVKVTVDEFQKMKKQVDAIRKDLEKRNPFSAFKGAWTDLTKALKNNGDVSGALQNLNAKGKEVTNTIRGWSESLGAVFGDRFAKSMGEIMDFSDGVMDMGTGIAQIWSGDIVGGITNALSGLSSIVSMFTSWKEKMEEMRREWYIAEIETKRSLREQAESYAESQSKITDIIEDVETLNWLIKNGFAKPASVSVWEAQSSALEQYKSDLKEAIRDHDDLWNKLQGERGYYEWGNSLNGGSEEWSLQGATAAQIELWYNQNKLSDGARAYYEAWVESGKSIDELVQKIEECHQAMQEMVMGVSFDTFLSNAKDVLRSMRSDISSLGEFTEETMANAILNAFMYKELAKMLEPLYDELSAALIDGTADEAYLENWRKRFEETMTNANERLDVIEETTGVDLSDPNGTSQSGKAGGFAAMTQDQGTKLEGMFTSGLQHWSSMDTRMEDVSAKMDMAESHLARIAENTGTSATHLGEIKEDIKRIIRDGLNVR